MKWDDMLPRVLPFAPGCPTTLAREALINAARRFAAETLVWNYQPTIISAVAGAPNYTLQLAMGEELVKVLLVEVDGDEYLLPSGVRGRQLARQGVCRICTMTGPHDFVLSPVPGDGAQILTEIAVKPSLTGSLKWPDDLDEHVPDITDGALATLLGFPGVDWRDSGEAGVRSERFDDRIAVVKKQVFKGLGRSPQAGRVEWF